MQSHWGLFLALEKLCCYSLHPFPEDCVVSEEIVPGLVIIAWLSLSSFNATFWKPVWGSKKRVMNHSNNYVVLLMTKARSEEIFLEANKISGISRSASVHWLSHTVSKDWCVCQLFQLFQIKNSSQVVRLCAAGFTLSKAQQNSSWTSLKPVAL